MKSEYLKDNSNLIIEDTKDSKKTMNTYISITIGAFIGLIGLIYTLFKSLIKTEAALNKSEIKVEMANMASDIKLMGKDIANIYEILKRVYDKKN